MDEPLMTSAEAAEYLHLAEGTVANMRNRGEGPRYCRIGKSPYYRQSWLDEYIETRVAPLPYRKRWTSHLEANRHLTPCGHPRCPHCGADDFESQEKGDGLHRATCLYCGYDFDFGLVTVFGRLAFQVKTTDTKWATR